MRHVRNLLKLLGLALLSGLLILLRYILRTPQPLASTLPGNEHLYKWTHGHIFYKVVGNIDAPPLLVLHTISIGSSAYDMLPIIEALAQHYRVYAPDLLGFGLSDHPALDYNAQLFAPLYQDFLRDVVKRPAIVLASGSSCNYAVAMASSSPALCTQLILLSPISLFARFRQLRWLHPLATSSLLSTFIYALLTPQSILRQVIVWQRGLDGTLISADDLNYSFAVAHQLGAHYAALASITGALHLDVTSLLARLSQPTLFLWSPQTASMTNHFPMPPQAQERFLGEGKQQTAAAHILHWQENMHTKVAIASQTDNTALANPRLEQISLPKEHITQINDTIAKAVQPDPRLERISPPTERATPANDATAKTIQPGQRGEDTKTKITKIKDVDESTSVEAFCVKCKHKRMMRDAHEIVTKNGRDAMEGTCPVCGHKLFRFISKTN